MPAADNPSFNTLSRSQMREPQRHSTPVAATIRGRIERHDDRIEPFFDSIDPKLTNSAEQQSNAILGNPIAPPLGTHLPSAPGLR
jgi:hypothetical protein